jgi:hypothetical protein
MHGNTRTSAGTDIDDRQMEHLRTRSVRLLIGSTEARAHVLSSMTLSSLSSTGAVTLGDDDDICDQMTEPERN